MTPNTDWASIASALAAIVALGISVWVALWQRKLQKERVRQDLFDKRYAVFLSVDEFVMYVLRVDGSFKMMGDEVRRFLYAVEQSEFLFHADVIDYMHQVEKTVFDLHPKAAKRDHLAKMNQNDSELNVQIEDVIIELAGSLSERRREVFRP
jgi:hypothetical protein